MRVVPTLNLVMSVATYMPHLKHVGVDTSYPMHVPLEDFPIIAVWKQLRRRPLRDILKGF